MKFKCCPLVVRTEFQGEMVEDIGQAQIYQYASIYMDMRSLISQLSPTQSKLTAR